MFNKIQKIYNAFGDGLSARIFCHRLAYSLSQDRRHIVNMLCCLDEISNVHKLIDYAMGRTSKPCVVFGAGSMALRFIADFKLPVACFCDNDPRKQGTMIGDKPIVAPLKLFSEYRDLPVLIPTVYAPEIVRQLRKQKFQADLIIAPSGHQYFDSLLPHSQAEIFVDAGAYNGMTSVDFIQWSGGRFDKIYVCEPDYQNMLKTQQNIEKHLSGASDKIVYLDTGLGDKDELASFSASNDSKAHFSTAGETTIRLRPLDDVLAGEAASFIKMDIEGSELAALYGAQNTIKVHQPILAISVYHKFEDILDIPQYILSICPDYVFYLRHYTLDDIETVLYAIPKTRQSYKG